MEVPQFGNSRGLGAVAIEQARGPSAQEGLVCEGLSPHGPTVRPPVPRYRGVTSGEQIGSWDAHIELDSTMVYLGSFATPDEAARAYDMVAISVGVDRTKKVARLITNFPITDYEHEHLKTVSPMSLVSVIRDVARKKLQPCKMANYTASGARVEELAPGDPQVLKEEVAGGVEDHSEPPLVRCGNSMEIEADEKLPGEDEEVPEPKQEATFSSRGTMITGGRVPTGFTRLEPLPAPRASWLPSGPPPPGQWKGPDLECRGSGVVPRAFVGPPGASVSMPIQFWSIPGPLAVDAVRYGTAVMCGQPSVQPSCPVPFSAWSPINTSLPLAVPQVVAVQGRQPSGTGEDQGAQGRSSNGETATKGANAGAPLPTSAPALLAGETGQNTLRRALEVVKGATCTPEVLQAAMANPYIKQLVADYDLTAWHNTPAPVGEECKSEGPGPNRLPTTASGNVPTGFTWGLDGAPPPRHTQRTGVNGTAGGMGGLPHTTTSNLPAAVGTSGHPPSFAPSGVSATGNWRPGYDKAYTVEEVKKALLQSGIHLGSLPLATLQPLTRNLPFLKDMGPLPVGGAEAVKGGTSKKQANTAAKARGKPGAKKASGPTAHKPLAKAGLEAPDLQHQGRDTGKCKNSRNSTKSQELLDLERAIEVLEALPLAANYAPYLHTNKYLAQLIEKRGAEIFMKSSTLYPQRRGDLRQLKEALSDMKKGKEATPGSAEVSTDATNVPRGLTKLERGYANGPLLPRDLLVDLVDDGGDDEHDGSKEEAGHSRNLQGPDLGDSHLLKGPHKPEPASAGEGRDDGSQKLSLKEQECLPLDSSGGHAHRNQDQLGSEEEGGPRGSPSPGDVLEEVPTRPLNLPGNEGVLNEVEGPIPNTSSDENKVLPGNAPGDGGAPLSSGTAGPSAPSAVVKAELQGRKEGPVELRPDVTLKQLESMFDKDTRKRVRQLSSAMAALITTHDKEANLPTDVRELLPALKSVLWPTLPPDIEATSEPPPNQMPSPNEMQAEVQAQRQAEVLAEVQAQRQAEVQAQRQAEVQAQRQAEVQAQRQAEVQAQRQAEVQAQRQAEVQAQRQAKVQALKETDPYAYANAMKVLTRLHKRNQRFLQEIKWSSTPDPASSTRVEGVECIPEQKQAQEGKKGPAPSKAPASTEWSGASALPDADPTGHVPGGALLPRSSAGLPSCLALMADGRRQQLLSPQPLAGQPLTNNKDAAVPGSLPPLGLSLWDRVATQQDLAELDEDLKKVLAHLQKGQKRTGRVKPESTKSCQVDNGMLHRKASDQRRRDIKGDHQFSEKGPDTSVSPHHQERKDNMKAGRPREAPPRSQELDRINAAIKFAMRRSPGLGSACTSSGGSWDTDGGTGSCKRELFDTGGSKGSGGVHTTGVGHRPPLKQSRLSEGSKAPFLSSRRPTPPIDASRGAPSSVRPRQQLEPPLARAWQAKHSRTPQALPRIHSSTSERQAPVVSSQSPPADMGLCDKLLELANTSLATAEEEAGGSQKEKRTSGGKSGGHLGVRPRRDARRLVVNSVLNYMHRTGPRACPRRLAPEDHLRAILEDLGMRNPADGESEDSGPHWCPLPGDGQVPRRKRRRSRSQVPAAMQNRSDSLPTRTTGNSGRAPRQSPPTSPPSSSISSPKRARTTSHAEDLSALDLLASQAEFAALLSPPAKSRRSSGSLHPRIGSVSSKAPQSRTSGQKAVQRQMGEVLEEDEGDAVTALTALAAQPGPDQSTGPGHDVTRKILQSPGGRVEVR